MEPTLLKSQLLQQIAQIQSMEPGKLCSYFLKGRPGKSGPYFKLQHHENGKNRTQYIPPEQVAQVQAAIKGYNSFVHLVREYSRIVIEQTRLERCGGVKKKTPNSSSPKIRKFNR